jgi:hypothetical protein
MGQRLRRFAEAHVVGQNAGEVLFAQELQPGQTFFLVGRNSRHKAGRRLDVVMPCALPQLVGQRQNIALALELPAAGVVEFGQARRVEARQAQVSPPVNPSNRSISVAASGLMRPAGTRKRLPLAVCNSIDSSSGNAKVQLRLQPACVATEEAGEQGASGQALAFDDDAHVEVEPAARIQRDRLPSHRPPARGGGNHREIRPASRLAQARRWSCMKRPRHFRWPCHRYPPADDRRCTACMRGFSPGQCRPAP